ncbi:MAG: hypothetical protein MJZ68_10120, partial [archaeon]|nr:hypothetical protein [archaeon]
MDNDGSENGYYVLTVDLVFENASGLDASIYIESARYADGGYVGGNRLCSDDGPISLELDPVSGSISLVVSWNDIGFGYNRIVSRDMVIELSDGSICRTSVSFYNMRLVTYYFDLDGGKIGEHRGVYAMYG